MIIEYSSFAGHYRFVDSHHQRFPGANTFTVIVGKNGTGKSRLLRNIILNLLGRDVPSSLFDRNELLPKHEPLGSLHTYVSPNKIICASTSPFDRFPLPRRAAVIPGYSYLGLRGLPSNNLSVSYLSKTINTLVDSIANTPERTSSITNILRYLGYEPSITISLQTLPRSILEELIRVHDPHSWAQDRMRTGPMGLVSDTLNCFRQMLEAPPRLILDAARRMTQGERQEKWRRSCEISIEAGRLNARSSKGDSTSDVLLYLKAGLLRLKEVILRKHETAEQIKISDASSGEQSVLLSLLGIGSQIRDGSLVCIDEPEVCLHPEWQEKYIQLLHQTFDHVSGCHFLIATHSPQIVAQLPEGNCHVMSMDTGIATNAKRYSHKSIDYQLAEVFGAPGFRNEYLSRVALSLFSSVSKRRAFDEKSRKTLSGLEKVTGLLQPGDPVLDIITALKEMRQQYE